MTTVARFDWTDAFGTHKNDIRWDEDSGGLAMCSGLDAYAQTIEAVVKTVRGELVTNIEYGVPWFTTIFNDRVYAPDWADAMIEVVSALDFVVSVDSFVYEYDRTRKVMTYKMEVTTTDGQKVSVSQE